MPNAWDEIFATDTPVENPWDIIATADPTPEVAERAVATTTADVTLPSNGWAQLETAALIQNPPGPETPPQALDILTGLRQQGFDAIVDQPSLLNQAVDVDMARWGAKHPWLAGPEPKDVPLVAGTLRRYFLTARALRAVPASPDDVQPGDMERAMAGAIDQAVAHGLLDQAGAQTIGAIPPATLRAAISWLQTDAEPPEPLAEAVAIVHAAMARGVERQNAEAVARAEEEPLSPDLQRSAVRGATRRWLRAYADGTMNVTYLRRLERAGVIETGALERFPVARLADLEDVPDPVEFAPSMPLMRHLGAVIAPGRPEPPGERIVAAESEWRQAVAEGAAMVPDRALRGVLADFLAPIGEVFNFVKTAVVDTDVALLKHAVTGEPFDPEAERTRSGMYFARGQAVLAKLLGQNALHYDIVARMRAGADSADKMTFVNEVANWGTVWDRTVDKMGFRQWYHDKFGRAGVLVADALDLVVSAPIIGVMPEDSGGAILNLTSEALGPLAFRHSLPGLATRYGWAEKILLARRRNPHTWQALQALSDDAAHLGVGAQRAIARRAADGALKAAKRLEKTAVGLGIQQAREDFAKARVLRKAAAVARATPETWRPALDALGSVDPTRALRAADPTGWLSTRNAMRYLGAFGEEELSALGARRAASMRAVVQPGPLAPPPALAAEFGVPFTGGAQHFADRALAVAADGGMLTDLYDIALDYQARTTADLRRRVRDATARVGADVAQPLHRQWREEAARLRALTSERRALRDLLTNPVASLSGAKGGRVLWEVVDDEFAELVSEISPRFRTRLTALRAKALARARRQKVDARAALDDPVYQKALAREMRDSFQLAPAEKNLAEVTRLAHTELRQTTGVLPVLDPRPAKQALALVDAAVNQRTAAQVRVQRLLANLKDIDTRYPAISAALEQVLQQRGLKPDVLLRRLEDTVRKGIPELFDATEDARTFLREFAQTEVDTLARLRAAGRISPQLFDELLAYHKPAVYRRPVTVGPTATGQRLGLAGELTREGDVLNAQHVPVGHGPRWGDATADWRAFYQSGPALRSRYLPTREAAEAFLRENRLKGTVLRPVDEVSQFIQAMEPSQVVARVQSLQRLLDLDATVQLQNAVARETGLVLTPTQAESLPRYLREGAGAEWLALPSNPRLGALSGQVVHKKLLTTLASHGRTNAWIRGVTQGLVDELQLAGSPLADSTAQLATQAAMRYLGVGGRSLPRALARAGRAFALTNWITLSVPTYVANTLFNVTGALIGLRKLPTTLFSSAFRRGARKLVKGHPDIETLARHGLRLEAGPTLTAGRRLQVNRLLNDLFDNTEWRQADLHLRRLQAMDVTALSASQHVMRERALLQLHEQLGRSLTQRGVRFLGAVAKRGGATLFDVYSAIDNQMKAGYANVLLEEGMHPGQIAREINTFFQDYSRVPPSVRWLSRSLFGSMVTSFPFEWLRLGREYTLRRPIELTIALGGLAGTNNATLAADHTTYGEWLKRLGADNSYLGAVRAMSTLHLPGGIDVDLGNMTGSNMLTLPTGVPRGQALEFARYDGALNAVLSAGLGVAGRFVLNNPAIASLYVFTSGRDPFTDRKLVDETATPTEKLGAKAMWLGRTLTPPWLPYFGGYHAELMQRDWDTRTQRSVPLTERLLRTIGVRRYEPAHAFANIVADARTYQAEADKYQSPLYGGTKELYDAWGHWCHQFAVEPSEGVFREGFEQLRTILGRPGHPVVGGVVQTRPKTEQQVRQALVRLARDGPVGQFIGLPTVSQAYVLTECALNGVDQTLKQTGRYNAWDQAVSVFRDGPQAYISPNPLARRLAARTGAAAPDAEDGAGLRQRSAAALDEALQVLARAVTRMPQHRELRVLYLDVRDARDAALRREVKRGPR